MGYKPNHVTIKAADKSVVCLTQPRGTLGDYVQHRLNIRRRTGDDPENLARRGLLVQCLAEFSRLRGDRFLLRGDRFLLRGNRLLLRSYRFLQLRKGFHVRCGARLLLTSSSAF